MNLEKDSRCRAVSVFPLDIGTCRPETVRIGSIAMLQYCKVMLMLAFRHRHLLLVGLVLLLGVQLTGLTCLGEWQAINYSAQAEMVSDSSSPEGNVLDQGCPCHFVFQSVYLPLPEILSPHADKASSSSTRYVPTFVVSLFHPPLSV